MLKATLPHLVYAATVGLLSGLLATGFMLQAERMPSWLTPLVRSSRAEPGSVGDVLSSPPVRLATLIALVVFRYELPDKQKERASL